MSNKSLIDTVATIVEDQCKSESNVFGYEGWQHHIKVVVKYALLLADKLDADKEIVELGALLHDYASVKDKDLYPEHHIHGAVEADKMLHDYGYPKEKIEQVKACILEHRGSIVYEKTSPESICVASADAISHIVNMPSLLHLAYVKKGFNTSDGAIWVSKKIERSWNKLCPEAKDMMEDTYRHVQEILGVYKSDNS